MMSTNNALPDFLRLAIDPDYKPTPATTMATNSIWPSPEPVQLAEQPSFPEVKLSPPEPQRWCNSQMDQVLMHLDAWERKRFTVEMVKQTQEVVQEAQEMLRFARQQADSLGITIDPSGLRTALDITTQYMRIHHHPMELPPGHALH